MTRRELRDMDLHELRALPDDYDDLVDFQEACEANEAALQGAWD